MTATIPVVKSVDFNPAIRYMEMVRGYRVLDASQPTDDFMYPRDFVDVRIYCSRHKPRSNRVHAIVWLNNQGTTRPYQGGYAHGQYDGCGLECESYAVAYALEALGVTLSEPINGRGSNKIVEAITAVATTLGAIHPFVIESYP